MAFSRILPVPPNSTALLELVCAVHDALSLPKQAAERDELTYLRIYRDRGRQVQAAMKRLMQDHEAGDSEVMAMVLSLRAHVGELGDDHPGYKPEPTA